MAFCFTIVILFHAEQQEKLKLIHDKFKEDIYQLLHDCKSTVEELEMHHNELKGTVKKQSMPTFITVDMFVDSTITSLKLFDYLLFVFLTISLF